MHVPLTYRVERQTEIVFLRPHISIIIDYFKATFINRSAVYRTKQKIDPSNTYIYLIRRLTSNVAGYFYESAVFWRTLRRAKIQLDE